MEEKETFKTPIWVNVSICILGILLGAGCIASGILNLGNGTSSNTSSSYSGFLIAIGVFALLFGTALIVLGTIGVFNHGKKERVLARISLGIGALYCLATSFNDLLFSLVYNSQNEGGAMVMALFFATIYLVSAILLAIGSFKMKKGPLKKGVALTGAIIFMGMGAFAYIYSYFPTGSSNTYIDKAPILVLLATSILLIVSIALTKNGEDPEEEEAPIKKPLPMNEEEKVKALLAYNDLLSKGIITQEEFEKKKSHLLD